MKFESLDSLLNFGIQLSNKIVIFANYFSYVSQYENYSNPYS